MAELPNEMESSQLPWVGRFRAADPERNAKRVVTWPSGTVWDPE